MQSDEPAYEVVQIPVSDLVADPFQPRRTFKEAAIQELAASIERHGILQPLLVRPLSHGEGQGKYCIVAGERRFRAAQRLGLKTVPCSIRPYLTASSAIVALAENVHRADLSDLEKAESLFRIKTLTDRTWEQVAELVSLSRDYVKRLAGLLRLEEAVKEWAREGKISTRVAIALRPLPPRRQIEMAERAIREGLTAEQVRELSRGITRPRLRHEAPAPPDLSAATDRLEPGTAEAQRDGSVLRTLRDLSAAVERMDEWVEARDWSPGRITSRQKQALRELRHQVGELEQHLAALCAPLREEPAADADKLRRAALF